MKEKEFLNSLSKHLFWETDISEINEKKHKKYIITKVLMYGLYPDWVKLVRHYTLSTIIDTALQVRELDKRTASFLAVVGDIPKNRFLCYNTKQSAPKHWNF
jgi:Family of unknown function (DUF6922)